MQPRRASIISVSLFLDIEILQVTNIFYSVVAVRVPGLLVISGTEPNVFLHKLVGGTAWS